MSKKAIQKYIDALRDDWYKTSYLLDRKQSMNGMAKKRYTNYKKQPIEMNFGYGFKPTLFGANDSLRCI